MSFHPTGRTAERKSRTISIPRVLAWSLSSLLTVGALSAGLGSCSVIVNADPESCTEDADCVNLVGRTRCDTEAGVCASADLCTSSADCPEDSYCTPIAPRVCAQLKRPADDPCNILFSGKTATDANEGAFRTDGAFVIGLTAPITGEDSSTGIGVLNGAKLAIEELNNSGSLVAPIVLIGCDDTGDSALAAENGRTLASLGVQAIIGPAYSGQTLLTANGTTDPPENGTVKNNVMVISPSATSPLVTGIQDVSPRCVEECKGNAECAADCPGLVWRTSPSDTIQAAGMAKYFSELEPIIRDRGGEVRTKIKVAVLYKPDPYGRELEKALKSVLEFNDKPVFSQSADYLAVEYSDPVDVDTDFADVFTFKPDVVFILGTGEIQTVLPTIEAGLATPVADRPYYVLSDGGPSENVAIASESFRDRVRGTVPGTNGAIYNQFLGNYAQRFGVNGNVFGSAGAYDTVFMLMFSASLVDGPARAEDLARGFRKLTSGLSVEVGSTYFGDGLNALAAGDSIDFVGASGALDFDNADEAASDIQVWCVTSKPDINNAGRFFNGATMEGSVDPGESTPATFPCPFE